MPSTVISTMEYDPETKTLTIAYVSGQTYVYRHVPETVFKELKASRVKGRYLRFFVKDKYAFERVTST